MNFGKREIVVMGQVVELNVDADLPIADISADMDKVAAQMAWWGSVWAAAEREKIDADAYYRRWRAQKTNDVLAADPKLAEWKLKAAIEADENFVKLKAALAQAEENTLLARNVFLSLDKKANQLQSRGAAARQTMAREGMATPAESRSASFEASDVGAPDDVSARVERLKEINRAKKLKGGKGANNG